MKPLDAVGLPLEGAALVEAGAGTGKTFTIETLYLRLLLEGGLTVDQILVVTYTRAATADLCRRIRARLVAALAVVRGEAPANDKDDALRAVLDRRAGEASARGDEGALLLAIAGFDEAAIQTIHGFCQRMLQEHAFESGVALETVVSTDDTELRDEIARDFWTARLCDAPEVLFRSIEKQVGFAGVTRLVGQALADPYMPVRPELPPAAGAPSAAWATALQTWRRARQVAADLWRTSADEVIDLLCGSAGLNRAVYRVETLRGSRRLWMDNAFSAEALCFEDKDFRYFTTARLLEGTKKGCATPSHPFFDACDELTNANGVLAPLVAEQVLRFQLDAVDYARREADRRHRHAGTMSYDDLLQRLHAALAGPNGEPLARAIRARFRAALIDEFQDTDAVQYDIFRRLFGGAEGGAEAGAKGTLLVMIGDPKQAIYGFRGADVFAYLKARGDVAANAHTLETNFRSDPRLITAVNVLFTRPRQPFVVEAIEFRPAGSAPKAGDALAGSLAGAAPLQILFHRGTRRGDGDARKEHVTKGDANDELPKAIAAEIVHLLASGATLRIAGTERPLVAADIAVLCRTNRQASLVQQAMRSLRVPSVLRSEASVFQSDEAQEMARFLAAMADPRDESAVRAALATAALGVDAEGLAQLGRDEPLWSAQARKFETASDAWMARGFAAGFRSLLDSFGVHGRVLALVDGERRMSNLLHLAELLQSAQGAADPGPAGLTEWFARMRAESAAAEFDADAAQVRLESDAQAVQLLTIHGSKGLEYPVVFCPFLWDGRLLSNEEMKTSLRFHDPEHDNRITLAIGPELEKRKDRAEWEALGENLRLLYVALTRAKHLCFAVWGPITDCESSALGYLLHSPVAAAQGADVVAAARQHIEGLGADAMFEELQELARASGGSIAVRELESRPQPPAARTEERPPPLSCRTPRRVLRDQWRVSSYSGLIAPSVAATESDRDARGVAAVAAVAETAASLASEAAAEPAAEWIPLHAFPAGTRAGQLIHAVLEKLDFRSAPEVVSEAVAAALPRFGFEAGWTETLAQALCGVLDTPLRPELKLRDIEPRRRLNELEFAFPVAVFGGAPPLTGGRLADVFRRGGSARVPPDYVRQLRQLAFPPLAGFVRGFVDLVFEHQGRWFVADYKSNHLGPRPQDYSIEALTRAMAEHHYFLQYHLYTVALHRYLGRRLPGYRYEEHFGGVLYLFLRGMSPRSRPGTGIFADRPPAALIASLSALLGDVAGPEATS